MKFLDLFKKKKKKRKPTERSKEAKYWQTILDNVIAYDGTERGQKPVE